MNLHQTIKKLRSIFSNNCDDVTRSQRFLTSIITTNIFSKMSIPEKLTSITKLIDLLQRDHGVASQELEETLLSLSKDLRHQELNSLYSIYNRNPD